MIMPRMFLRLLICERRSVSDWILSEYSDKKKRKKKHVIYRIQNNSPKLDL